MWSALFCFTVIAILIGISEFLSVKSRGYISTLVFASVLFLIGFWSGILPPTVISDSALPIMMSAFGVPLIITNLGTIISLEEIMAEWKTACIALLGLVGLALSCMTVGTMLFGREYALTAAPPISGGTIAALIVSDFANGAGRSDLAAFAILLLSCQGLLGMPIVTLCLKKEIARLQKNGQLLKPDGSKTSIKLPAMKLLPDMPKEHDTNTKVLARMGFVAVAAFFVATLTLIPGSSPATYLLNPSIAYMLFGLIFTRINFLPKNSLKKSGAEGLIMFGMIATLPASYADLSPAKLLEMIGPILGLLIIGASGIALIAAIIGKFLGYSVPMSVAIGLTALIGYPGTQLLSEDAVSTMSGSDEEKKAALAFILPKMIVGGFVTVTIASVAFAGIIAPMIFR